MNCKPGDLAVVIASTAGNEGRIVTVRSWIGSVLGFDGADRWAVDGEMNTTLGNQVSHARDSQLCPIRDPGDDAVDETLLWLPSPHKESA